MAKQKHGSEVKVNMTKQKMTSWKLLTISVVIAGAMSTGCSNQTSKIQRDLNDNPQLKQKGITAQVKEVKNGYVTITVKGLSDEATAALQEGRSLRDIFYSVDTDIEVLQSAEAALKKRPSVKGVLWVALGGNEKLKRRNIAVVELAKGVLTLPASPEIEGAMGADKNTVITSGEGLRNLLKVLEPRIGIKSLSELTINGEAIDIGDMNTKAHY